MNISRLRVSIILGRDRSYTDEEADAILASPQGHFVEQMMRYTAVGTPDQVQPYLADFAKQAGPDELMVVHAAPTIATRLRSVELLPGHVPRGERRSTSQVCAMGGCACGSDSRFLRHTRALHGPRRQ